jgi:hypothetical protein
MTRVRTAWLWLVGAVALHVADEAATGFLDVYNPTVGALRERLGWFPMPEFGFEGWLTGLTVLVVVLALLTPLVDRGPGAVRTVATVFAVLMALNGAGHMLGTIAGRTVDTVRFARPMPGAWSSPILIGAAAFFIVGARSETRDRYTIR